MKTAMPEFSNPVVANIFSAYPKSMRQKLMFLRQLVFETAAAEGIEHVEETIKWGEPSYIAKGGSTIRMDWKKSNPKRYALYFHCQTRLIDTFRELYPGTFRFEGNRAILFDEHDKVPVDELKHCISLSLTYKSRKHLPMLGV